MNLRAVIQHKFFKPVAGAMVLSACGVLLGEAPLGAPWSNASYDYLFLFSERAPRGPSNQVAIVWMDNVSYRELKQQRGQWSRKWHAQLLNKLTEDGASLVVFDILFREASSKEADAELFDALRRHRRTVLMASVDVPKQPGAETAQVTRPYQPFREVSEWGLGKAGAEWGEIVRQHWPFPAPSPADPSLGWTAARLAGASLPEEPVEQWLRYYKEGAAWKSYSYYIALLKPAGHFTNTIVFIGSEPEHDDPYLVEVDKFLTPRSRWNPKAVGGVEIMATTFLNLMNRDWLRRPPAWIEWTLFILAGSSLALVSTMLRPGWAVGVVLVMSVLVFLVTICLGYFGNHWFPWLAIVGGQAPLTLGWVLLGLRRQPALPETGPQGTVVVPPRPSPREKPDAPDYQFDAPAFGEGAFGKVWLVRNAIGEWQALKAVYQSKFGDNVKPYEAEFHGIQQYKPISGQHLGLLRVDFISQKKPEGYFYYVMELGDSRVGGWEENPALYRPLDLASACEAAEKKRLPLRECFRIGIVLAEALAFLHERGLTHRDIKPSNIIFVKGQPKLADVGLVTPARPPEEVTTFAGTPGYMPPAPEPPGTTQADVYALGMVLFVISTGRQPVLFPELKTSLISDAANAEFLFLNQVILQACAAEASVRFRSAVELREALLEAERKLGSPG